ncbi:MAG: trypsin-like peptidase domain-containing protein, partial [Lachnospiraceae bacterium]|nr:trypsin-like peptidase domain-containing protein [Lachnospiraceae bacterium]
MDMYEENSFEKEGLNTNEVYTECRVLEPQDHKKKGSGKKRIAKLAAAVLCAALLTGGGFAAGSYWAKPAGSSYEAGAQGQDAGQGRPEANGPQQGDDANAGNRFAGGQSSAGDAQTMSSLLATAGANQGKQVYTPAQIAEKYLSSVVAITAKSTSEVYSFFGGKQEYESEGAGSGIIVAKTDKELIIATNNHVVEGAKELSVCFNDNEEQIYSGYIKGTDPSNDLAVVGVKLSDIPEKVLDTLTVAVLGDSDACVMGEQVVAIGNALGYGQSLTSGYISALDRVVTVEDVTYTLIQIDAAINPGNSGGALFNMYGEVIGINSVKFASSKIEGMRFALPIRKALPILNRLAEREPRELVAE